MALRCHTTGHLLPRLTAGTAALPPPTRHQDKTLPASSPVARSPASPPAPRDGPRGDPHTDPGGPHAQHRGDHATPRGSAGQMGLRAQPSAGGSQRGQPPGPARWQRARPAPRTAAPAGQETSRWEPAEGRAGPAPLPLSLMGCLGPSRPPTPPRRPRGEGEPRSPRRPRHLLGLRAARQPRLQLAHNFQHRLRHFYCWRGRGGGNGFTARWPHGDSPTPPPPSWLRAGNGSGAAVAPTGGGHGGYGQSSVGAILGPGRGGGQRHLECWQTTAEGSRLLRLMSLRAYSCCFPTTTAHGQRT